MTSKATPSWKAAALERGAWDDTVIEGGRRFMAGWRDEEESAAITWQRKREAEEADKVVVSGQRCMDRL